MEVGQSGSGTRPVRMTFVLTMLWQAGVSPIEPHVVELLDEMSLYVPTPCHAINQLP